MSATQPSWRTDVRSSVLFGIVAVGWSAFVSIASVRWYIELLGIKNYGLIGFFATLQAAIGVLDLGLGATINREVARSLARDDLDRARRLLRSLEFVYMGVAAMVAGAILLSAPLIATFWLRVPVADQQRVSQIIAIMGLVVALRWPIGLYLGALVGMHRAPVSYVITGVMATVANVGAVLFLTYVNRTLASYFLWMAVAGLAYLLVARHAAWRELGGRSQARFDGGLLRSVLFESAVLSIVAISGLLLTQMDKLIVSSTVSLVEFGHYTLASVLASGMQLISIPAFNLIYPRLSALTEKREYTERLRYFRAGTQMLLGFVVPAAGTAAVFSGQLIYVWTGNASVAGATRSIAALLIAGTALNCVMLFSYATQLAAGRDRIPLVVNCLQLALMLPTMIVLVRTYGALGAAIGWLCLNGVYAVLTIIATKRVILRDLALGRLVGDFAIAFAVTTPITIVGKMVIEGATQNAVVQVLLAAGPALLAGAVLLAVFGDARRALLGAWPTRAVR